MPEMPYLWMETWEKQGTQDVVLVFEKNTGGIRVQEQAGGSVSSTSFSNIHKFETYELAIDWLRQNLFALKGDRSVFSIPKRDTPPTLQK